MRMRKSEYARAHRRIRRCGSWNRACAYINNSVCPLKMQRTIFAILVRIPAPVCLCVAWNYGLMSLSDVVYTLVAAHDLSLPYLNIQVVVAVSAIQEQDIRVF